MHELRNQRWSSRPNKLFLTWICFPSGHGDLLVTTLADGPLFVNKTVPPLSNQKLDERLSLLSRRLSYSRGYLISPYGEIGRSRYCPPKYTDEEGRRVLAALVNGYSRSCSYGSMHAPGRANAERVSDSIYKTLASQMKTVNLILGLKTAAPFGKMLLCRSYSDNGNNLSAFQSLMYHSESLSNVEA